MNNQKLNLAKEVVLDLTKKSGIEGQVARVMLCIDRSGSMSELYRDGTVQKVISRLVPIAMAFDDNQEMEVVVFDDEAQTVKSVTTSNLDNYVQKVLNKLDFGGTNYAPAIKEVMKLHGTPYSIGAEIVGFIKSIFGKKKEVESVKVDIPTYVIFITDGENFDERETESVLIEASKQGIFFQFVGIGGSRFPQLERLDTMEGRFIDNANFFSISTKDLVSLPDNQFYSKLLYEYPDWVKLAKSKNIIL